jgi:hypothetical protein
MGLQWDDMRGNCTYNAFMFLMPNTRHTAFVGDSSSTREQEKMSDTDLINVADFCRGHTKYQD